MATSLLMGPCGVEARVIPTIKLPKVMFKVVGPVRCGRDVGNNQPQVSGPSQGGPKGSPALIGAPTFSGGNKKLTSWGKGWFSENDQTMEVNPDRSLTWTDGVGNQANFAEISGSTMTVPVYSIPAGLYITLTAVSHANGVPTAMSERDKDGTTRLFEVAESTSILRFSRLTDRNGNTITYTRDSQGRLTRFEDVHGRYFTLSYSTSGFVSSLSDWAGWTSNYAYDGQGRRIGETGPQGPTSYEYDSENRLTRIAYPNGGVKNYAYDSYGRVLSDIAAKHRFSQSL